MPATLNDTGKSSLDYLDTGNTEVLFFFGFFLHKIAKYHKNIETKNIHLISFLKIAFYTNNNIHHYRLRTEITRLSHVYLRVKYDIYMVS